MKPFIKIAWENLLRNWRRSLLIIIVIAVGLAGLIFTWGGLDNANEQIIDNHTENLTGHLQIQKEGFFEENNISLAMDNPQAIISTLSQLSGIQSVAERIEGKVFLSYKEKSAGAVLIGIEPSKEVMVTNLWKAVKAGRYLQATDASAMVLGEAMRKRLGVNLGDEIAVITQAADGSMGAAKYKVVGIYDTGTNSFEWGYVFIPLPAARDLFALWGRSNEIVIKVKNRSSAPGIKIALAKVLTPHKIAVLDWWQLVPELIGGYNLRRAVLYLVLLTVFLIVANGITNTILMSVAERTREFGVLMALGTSGGQIVILVVLEAFFVGLAGILSGGILGLAVISVINLTGINFTSYAEYLASGGGPAFPLVIYPVFTLRRFYLLSGMVLLVSVLAAIYPAVKAARLKPARAISQMETI